MGGVRFMGGLSNSNREVVKRNILNQNENYWLLKIPLLFRLLLRGIHLGFIQIKQKIFIQLSEAVDRKHSL